MRDGNTNTHTSWWTEEDIAGRGGLWSLGINLAVEVLMEGGRGVIEDDDPCCKRNTNLFDVRMEVFAGMTMVGVN